MKALILPIVLGLAGAGAGIGAGLWLQPTPQSPSGGEAGPSDPGQESPGGDPVSGGDPSAEPGPGMSPMSGRDRPPIEQIDFVRMTNQFVVPVLRQGDVAALVVVSVGVEVRAGLRDMVFAREPKLRDAFLRVMFDHANAGGFDGVFTSGPQMATLRRNLWEAARPVLGADLFDVLITDIARQDT
ncbi:flagellar basal body-associated protein FliL [Rhodovulum sp. 12E13]|uniref:flagellar basal body-associated protein FliL n=1 Tax=Rhodovulum sp. 12E13 TaxID=2203891 RepID=UPI000E12A127|nr:flagellar basal body-associated protein FliL [Rhodovulum sp. 12E13]RDC74868.1 flagellar basal body-associated protein FliL [Rhodovulum sp. 12E13]